MGQLPEKDEDLGPPVVELEGQVIGVPHLNRGIFKHSATNCQQSVRQPPSTSCLATVSKSNCQQAVSQLSASCQPTVIKLPGKRQQVVRQLLSSCQANVSKLFGNCQHVKLSASYSQLSASCQLTASNSE